MATIDSEIPVGGQDNRISKRFGHTNQASIGEAHRNVGVFLDKLSHWLYAFGNLEGDDKGPASKQ